MNKKRRELLKSVRPFLIQAARIIEQAVNQENDCLDNMPENLQDTDRYDKMEKAVENLEAALEHIENAQECVSEAIA